LKETGPWFCNALATGNVQRLRDTLGWYGEKIFDFWFEFCDNAI